MTALLLGLLAIGVFAASARAAGTPDISATVTSSSPLYGEPVHVTLDAANPSIQPYGYNLSYRVVLPKGVSYAGGSSVPPTVITNQPASEQTTLIFSNTADLSPASHKELGFNLTYDQSIWHAGDTIPVQAQAFINSDPRFVPKFSPTGQPEGPSSTSYTGFSAAVVGQQLLKAIKVTAEEPSPEGEILRGVHEDQTVYTLKVQNNGINPTTGTKLDAYVPAGLEYLGCGAPGGAGTDHTHDAIATNPGSAEEYPGSGPIKVESLAGCSTPELVETEEVDPDGSGPMSFGVYTHVRWDVGALTAGEVKTFKYRAAIPIRANAKNFTGGAKPSGASGEQAANLDNNTGPEVLDEALLSTFATASGTYQGSTPMPTSDETILDRTAEDWVVHKGVEASRLEQGQNVKWTLTFETSEYKYVNEGVVTDTLPNGLCPLGPKNFTIQNDPADAECDPVAGKEPSFPYSSAVENANGTWTLTWNAAQFTPVQHTGINAKFTLTFWTHTRTHYQQNFEPTTPILSRDKVTNNVTTEAEGFARCLAPEATNCENPATKISHEVPDGTRIVDGSSATIEAESPTLEKFVSTGSANCATATYVKAPTVPKFHPGDTVCWKLRITFPGTLDTNAQTIADFLPPGSKYVAGSDAPHGENNVNAVIDESSAGSGVLTWTAENTTVPAGGQIFERVIATEVAPVGNVVDGDLKGNLLKFSSANTPGESEALRAEANYEITIPEIGLVKGVEKVVRGGTTVNGPNGEDTDHIQVEEGDEVTYRVDLHNTGGQEAINLEVWDILPAEYSCSEVTAIAEAGECLTTGPGDHIVWHVPTLPFEGAENHKKLTYTVKVPPNVGPGRTLVNTAGVAQFQGATNTGGHFTYTPAENINPANATEPNAPAAKDPSNVFTAGAAVGKTETTSVNEGGNNAGTQATIGETITYTITAEVPEGTTLGGQAELTDTLNSAERQAYVAGSAEATLNGAALPGGFTLDTSGTTPKVIFPAGYNNAAGSGVDKVALKFSVVVTNVPANVRGATLTDQAKLAWIDPTIGPQSASSSTLTTTVVEPLISQEKTDNKNPSRVVPGEIVTYTVKTANSAAANVSTAHGTELVDHVPVGLIPLNPVTLKPVPDGAIIAVTGGAVWHAGTRTITKAVPDLGPGASSSYTYKAEIEKPAVAGSTLTNKIETTTASLAAGPTQRRTSGSGYAAKAEDTVRLVSAGIEKSTTPGSATPGNPLTYHLKVTIPSSIELFDTTVRDVLPTGVEFDGYGAVTCLSGCPLANETHEYKPSINGTNGKETIAWDLGDIPALAEPQVIEFTYAAHLRATNRVVGGNVVKGNTEVNAATVNSDLTNKQGAFNENEIPATFDETSAEAKTTTTVIEPQLSIDKKIKVGTGPFGDGPTVAHSNEPLSYQLVVTNAGNSPAYDVEVTDTPDVAVTNVQVVPQAGVTVTEPWSPATHAMKLAIAGPIPAGGSTTIEYTAEFLAASELHDGQKVKNTAAVPVYFGVPSAERLAHPTWEFRQYNGGTDSTEAVLDFPTFTLVKTTGLSGNPDTGKAEVGQDFPWRIVAANTSATAGATNVKVTDTLPPNWSYTAGTAKFNGSAAPDPTITPNAGGDTLEWTVPSLAAASSVTITYDAKPLLAAETNPGTGVEANVNTALISAATDEGGNSGNEEGPYGTPPDTAKATLGVPVLTLEKTPDGGPATAGKPSSFTIKVKNTGNGVARNLDVKDMLPPGLSYTAGAASGTPNAIASETVSLNTPGPGETTIHWHLASLAEGATETITVPVGVAASVPAGESLINVASVTSDEVTTPPTDNGSLVVSTEADLSIEKSGAAAYTAGTDYTWHLRVKNLGPSDAQGVEVTDPLPAGTTFVSADAPCAPSGTEVKCVLGNVGVGFDQTYDVTVHVDPNATASPLANTAAVDSQTTDPDETNNHSTFGPTPGPLADVSVKKTAAPELILKSQETTFTIEVANAGPSTARAVKVVDPLPIAGLEFLSADPPCTAAAGTVICEFGDLEPGAVETVQVKAKGIANGLWANTATVSTTTPEPPGPEAEENNHSTAEVGVGPVTDLAIVKTAPATVAAGGQLTWALEVTNKGPDAATGVKVTDPLPAGVTFVSADPGCVDAGGAVECALGNLPAGESTTVHITVTVPPALGDQTLLNTATVTGDQGDLEPEDNHSEAKTTVGPSADLALTKTGPAQVSAGGDITWTLIAVNKGPSTATGVTVDDALPSGVALVSASPSQGSCGGAVSCVLGTLPSGGSAQIQVVANVPAALENTNIVNTAKIRGDQPDPVADNNSSGVTTQVVDPPPTSFNLTLVKSLVGPAKPQLGDVLTYTLKVGNEGPAEAKAVVITDTLPGALEYVSSSLPGGKCSAAGPVVTCKLAALAAGVKKTATLKARAVGTGEVKNTASVSAAHADAKQADNHDTAAAYLGSGRAVLHLTKQRLGRGAVEAGQTVKFRIRVSATGASGAQDTVVCDRLPAAMSFVSVAGAKFVKGDACWTIPVLPPGKSRSFTVVARIDAGVGGRTIRNVATAEAANAPARSAAAPVRVKSSGPGRGGGVTG